MVYLRNERARQAGGDPRECGTSTAERASARDVPRVAGGGQPAVNAGAPLERSRQTAWPAIAASPWGG